MYMYMCMSWNSIPKLTVGLCSQDHQSARDRLTKSRLEVGMVCCAQFDGEWHRAMVTEIPTTSSKVREIIIILMYTDLAE